MTVSDRERGMIMKNYFDLKGNVAIVTGCSTGLGVQMAKALANQGAAIVPVARRQELIEEVAKELNIHESTVSRAVKAKYIQCSSGAFPVSHFFSRSVPAGTGKISAAEVKNAIRDLIEQEDRRKPLSDQKICDMLAEKRIDISRRAVAKYRDEMGIPSTSGRKAY